MHAAEGFEYGGHGRLRHECIGDYIRYVAEKKNIQVVLCEIQECQTLTGPRAQTNLGFSGPNAGFELLLRFFQDAERNQHASTQEGHPPYRGHSGSRKIDLPALLQPLTDLYPHNRYERRRCRLHRTTRIAQPAGGFRSKCACASAWCSRSRNLPEVDL